MIFLLSIFGVAGLCGPDTVHYCVYTEETTRIKKKGNLSHIEGNVEGIKCKVIQYMANAASSYIG